MAVNTSPQFQADIVGYIADEVLPLTRKQLVAYQFADKATLPEGRGTTYTATRYQRLPLPFAPLSEGVPPIGETLTIQQVTAICQQWGDKVTITDVAELTIFHPLFKQATFLTGLQISETLERNTQVALLAGTQVNYVNTKGSRGALAATDVMDTTTIIRTQAALVTLGAPRYLGDEETDTKIEAEQGGSKASSNPRANPHYVALIHPLVAADFRTNPTVVTAWSYSDLNRLYNAEAGEWSGIRFCESNMIPSFTGFAQINPTAVAGGGSLTAANYYVVVTGTDSQNQYESQIYQVSNAVMMSAGGSATVQLPNVPGFTYSVYIGTTASPMNLALCPTLGPTSGPLQGQAVQLPFNTLVTVTGVGVAQTPPAAPTTGVTVYPTYVLGRGAYTQVKLKDVEFTYLMSADKSDVLNQLRIIGWKCFYGTLLSNVQFMARIESSSSFSATFG